MRLTGKPYSMTVELDNAGGIFEGSEVAYRGVGVGRVSSIDLHSDGVTITLDIDSGTDVPDNATAHIYDLSAVGEQYVDLEPPKRPSSTFLKSGSVIPRERTTTPLQTATVLYDLERFVSSINPVDVQIIGREGALAFQGAGGQLRSILVDTTKIVEQLSTTPGQHAAAAGQLGDPVARRRHALRRLRPVRPVVEPAHDDARREDADDRSLPA